MNKLHLSTLSLLLISSFSMAQHATLKGKVKNTSGKPAEFANIVLQGTTKGAVSDETGEYKIENINPGTYTITVSGIGIQKKNDSIVIAKGNELYVVDFTVVEGIGKLDEVVVSGYRERTYRNEMSIAAAK